MSTPRTSEREASAQEKNDYLLADRTTILHDRDDERALEIKADPTYKDQNLTQRQNRK